MATPDFIRTLRASAGQQLLFLPVVSAIVFYDDGRVLLAHRADNGRWSIRWHLFVLRSCHPS